MAELKTKKTAASVEGFLKKVADPEQRADALAILKIMKSVTRLKPMMWGPSMVGFGEYHYRYPSGHEGVCFLTGFSPRKGKTTLYITPGFGRYPHLMKKLGKFKTGKSCLYIKRLEDVDVQVLKELIHSAMNEMDEILQECCGECH